MWVDSASSACDCKIADAGARPPPELTHSNERLSKYQYFKIYQLNSINKSQFVFDILYFIFLSHIYNIIEYISVAGAFCIIYVISVTISYHSMAEFAEFAFCLVRVLRQKKWILQDVSCGIQLAHHLVYTLNYIINVLLQGHKPNVQI